MTPLAIDRAEHLVIDSDGNVSVVGQVGTGFESTPGAHDDRRGEIAVRTIDATGQTLWAARIGGSGAEGAGQIAVDDHGNVYLAGMAFSQDFPTTDGALGEHYWYAARNRATFVVKLSPSGRLLYAARIPGSEFATGMDVGSDGSAYVTGVATDDFVPSSGAFDTERSGGSAAYQTVDGYVVKISPTGSRMVWGTLIGGSGDEVPGDVELAPDGGVVVGGTTWSNDFPTTLGSALPVYPDPNADQRGFAAKLAPDGRSAAWSTYIEAAVPSEEYGHLAVAHDGRVDVIGSTQYDGPRAAGTPRGGGMIAQLSADGSAMRKVAAPAFASSPNPTLREDQIVGVGFDAVTDDSMALRLGFDGNVISALPLSFQAMNAVGDAASIYALVSTRPLGLRGVGGSATRAKPALARYARCTVRGTSRNDVLRGTPGPDVICGFGGNDRLIGGDAYDVLIGGAGRDRLSGGQGVDVLVGGRGADVLVGGRKRDLLKGGRGADTLYGGRGPDRLFGGADDDRLFGGAAHDFCRDRQGRNAFRSCP